MLAGHSLRGDEWDEPKPRNKRKYDKDSREKTRRDNGGRPLQRFPKRARNEDDDVSDYDDDFEDDDLDLDDDDDFDLDDDDFELDDDEEEDDWEDEDDED